MMLKALVYDRVLIKNAIKQVASEFGVSRRSLYNYCRKFGIVLSKLH